MGRLSTFEDREIFAAVGAKLAGAGRMTFQTIVQETGVSVGSLYHRFESREGLLARTWLDAVRAFQARFISELGSGGDDAGERAALATPRFCRDDQARAIVLSCCRSSEFVSDATPEALREEVHEVNDAATLAVRRYAKQTGFSLEALRFGLVAFPLGAVRLYLPQQAVPKAVDSYVAAAFWSAVREK